MVALLICNRESLKHYPDKTCLRDTSFCNDNQALNIMLSCIFILLSEAGIWERNKFSLREKGWQSEWVYRELLHSTSDSSNRSIIVEFHCMNEKTFISACHNSETNSIRSCSNPPPPLEQTSTLMMGSILQRHGENKDFI